MKTDTKPITVKGIKIKSYKSFKDACKVLRLTIMAVQADALEQLYQKTITQAKEIKKQFDKSLLGRYFLIMLSYSIKIILRLLRRWYSVRQHTAVNNMALAGVKGARENLQLIFVLLPAPLYFYL